MKLPALNKPLLVTLALAIAAPALAQTAADPGLEARVRKLEGEVAALQRVVFPGGDGRFFPQLQPGQPASSAPGTPASTPSADMLGRLDSMEGQLARLTAQVEEDRNRLDKIEARLDAIEARGAAPAAVETATPPPAPKPVATTAPAPKPVAAASDPSARRLAAVRAIAKPQTDDPGDDEYSYGFRLWEAKFQPEAQQQLKLFLNKYPRHARVSFARNLLGRSYLDEGNPREAASWFLQNYQADKKGDRAPDSLLYLAESMRQLKDAKRACVALDQFAREYPKEAAGRLKGQYDSTKGKVTC